jgi:hypothetical protein
MGCILQQYPRGGEAVLFPDGQRWCAGPKEAQLRVGIIGATLTVNWLTHSDLAVAGTPTGVVVSSL